MLWLSVAIALAALLLCVGALRGRRIDEAPLCRRCRFDLTGLHPGVETCPECGRSLGGHHAVRIGRRRVRRAALAVGLLLLVGSGGMVGAIAWGRATAFDWNTVKPAWMLIGELDGADTQHRARAMAELLSRATANELGDASCNRLARMALDAQAESYAAWTGASPNPFASMTRQAASQGPSWAEMFETLLAAGHVTREQMDRYHEQVVETITIDLDPEGEAAIERGVPLVIGRSLARVTPSDRGRLELWLREASLESDGPAPMAPYPPGAYPVRLDLGTWAPGGNAPQWLFADVVYARAVAAVMPEVAGRYEVSVVYEVELRAGKPDYDDVIWTRSVPVEGVVEVP